MSRVLGPTVIVTCRPSRASRRADGVASLLSAVKGDAPARSATGKDAGAPATWSFGVSHAVIPFSADSAQR